MFEANLTMHNNFRHLDLQSLLDLLAEETEKYTKAFISGDQNKTALHKVVLDALVEEINIRKSSSLTDKNKSGIATE
jgi:flagellar biosynthesis component FlhA